MSLLHRPRCRPLLQGPAGRVATHPASLARAASTPSPSPHQSERNHPPAGLVNQPPHTADHGNSDGCGATQSCQPAHQQQQLGPGPGLFGWLVLFMQTRAVQGRGARVVRSDAAGAQQKHKGYWHVIGVHRKPQQLQSTQEYES